MKRDDIQKIISDILEKVMVSPREISVAEEKPGSLWFSVEVSEPHYFISHEGEGLQALNHLVHRIIEAKSAAAEAQRDEKPGAGVLVDVNGFQRKRVENIRAIAHMMSERARYFKSSIEVDPMTAFERRIIHEFLADATDLKTESIGSGRSRRVVIKYVGDAQGNPVL